MRYRRLGRTGLEVSELGLGTVELGQDWGIEVPGEFGCPEEADALKLLDRAVELGVNFLDTARVYKKSEERIGRFLKSMGSDAERVHVATKVYLHKKDGPAGLRRETRSCLERSLQALQLECIDLVQLHSARAEDIADSTAWEVLDKARDEGLLCYIGATFYDAEAARAAVECGAYETIQVTYNPLMFSAGPVIDLAAEKEVGVIVKSPLLKGAFSYKREHLSEEMRRTRELAGEFRFLERSDQTLPQGCVRYALARPGVSTVIAGTQRVRHLEENAEGADGALTAEELSRIEELQKSLDLTGAEIP
jgi:aryl-alcohol dehydrogenase-like predicted oxidoreductase